MIVYTIIYNNYDNLKEPTVVDPDCEYIVFSNTPQKSKVWKWMEVGMSEIKDQRKIKITGPTNRVSSAYSIKDNLYIDASILIRCKPSIFCAQLEGDLVMLQHRGRDCIYKEGAAVLDYGKEEPEIVKEQLDKYRDEGYPECYGLIQTGWMLRRFNQDVADFSFAWWEEVKTHSKRDQLSFNYVAWKLNKEYEVLDNHIFRRGFRLFTHG